MQAHLEHAQEPRLRQIDAIRAVAQIVSPHGDDRALALQRSHDLLLRFCKFRMSGVNRSPLGKSFVDVRKGVERIERQHFRLSGDRIHHDPRIRRLQVRASACRSREGLAACSRFIERKSLVNEQRQFRRSCLRPRRIFRLARRAAGEDQGKSGSHGNKVRNGHYSQTSLAGSL